MKTKPHNSGIYKITEVETGKVYIGSSQYLDYRKRNHFNLLRRGKHKNPYLQAYFNWYGPQNFTWDIIEYLPTDNKLLKDRESHWIDVFRANEKEFGFNLRKVCYNNTGVPGRGKIAKGENNHKAIAYHLVDIHTGEEYTGRCIAEFCRQHGISDASGYFVLARGDIHIWQKRFMTKEQFLKFKRYEFQNVQTGRVIGSYHLKSLCLANNLSPAQMSKVHRGKCQEHKGWIKFTTSDSHVEVAQP